MQRYGRDPRGRIFFVLLWAAVPLAFLIGLELPAWSDVVPVWLAILWPTTLLGAFLVRYTGGVRIEGGQILVHRTVLHPWRSMELLQVRHLRFLVPWHGIRGYWYESIDLFDDTGRRMRIPSSVENCDELGGRLRALLLGTLREKRMAEWQDNWSLTFRCPGPRWAAHAMLALVALSGGALGVLLWRFWRQIPDLTLWFGGGTIAILVLALIPLRARLSWIGARIELRSTGVRIRRVDYDREFPWAALQHCWMGEWSRVQLDFQGKTIAIPSSVEDRDLLLEFLSMGHRRAFPVSP